ncbi:carbonic anhydrase [Clostridium sp. JNZ J1-5]|nr:carbonic anhydrase [Clostridium sp.]
MKEEFAAAISCIDGRAQQPVIDYMKNKYGIKYLDMITEPGPNKIVADQQDITVINSIKRKLDISIGVHGSKVIAVVGHYDCAGNPVGEEEHIRYIKSAVNNVKEWGLNVEVIGLWVNHEWQVIEI